MVRTGTGRPDTQRRTDGTPRRQEGSLQLGGRAARKRAGVRPPGEACGDAGETPRGSREDVDRRPAVLRKEGDDGWISRAWSCSDQMCMLREGAHMGGEGAQGTRGGRSCLFCEGSELRPCGREAQRLGVDPGARRSGSDPRWGHTPGILVFCLTFV